MLEYTITKVSLSYQINNRDQENFGLTYHQWLNWTIELWELIVALKYQKEESPIIFHALGIMAIRLITKKDNPSNTNLKT